MNYNISNTEKNIPWSNPNIIYDEREIVLHRGTEKIRCRIINLSNGIKYCAPNNLDRCQGVTCPSHHICASVRQRGVCVRTSCHHITSGGASTTATTIASTASTIATTTATTSSCASTTASTIATTASIN
ncbi:hypothetical protein PPL_01481 [Heterostelium album PN500]|uniref:Uncharacterized protein n=1 Tax=Heterostelium pallidum (strain ATCC 26659 / Pp 5 / PN500) TaxID=670386 RepID=D3AZE1_HETP5|nr:hypothetical protein PPL_01481 [Heterostelium album PN500]EFA85524.1 hypothetical protein PPL_01481 [Heterostelium album PN500]|eukprot:XP_020437632.1 hypothetical protein PPL_01481 [Heterostelium album PN500]